MYPPAIFLSSLTVTAIASYFVLKNIVLSILVGLALAIPITLRSKVPRIGRS